MINQTLEDKFDNLCIIRHKYYVNDMLRTKEGIPNRVIFIQEDLREKTRTILETFEEIF